MLYPEMSIKEGVAKETLIGLASIRYGCSNLYHGATLTFFQCRLEFKIYLIYNMRNQVIIDKMALSAFMYLCTFGHNSDGFL